MDMVLYEKPLKIELVGSVLFVNGGQHPKSVRTIAQMKNVMMGNVDETATMDLYYMYRSVYVSDDIRFDITVIPPAAVKGEYAKTFGHYHPGSEDGLAYPEAYQVLRGSAVFLMQKRNRNGSVDTIVVRAKEGDVVLLPPGYGHVSINNGPDTLILSNLVYDRFESVYSDFEENRGAAYYYLKDGEIVQNSNYIVQKSEQLAPAELNLRYGFDCKDLLSAFHANPKEFEFLKKPKTKFKG
ncbi:glucose-6-phosphate isomerase [Candidatus Micrarchaeota archaeon]|nr:glucose-6-phosphate isomerase [Candidatus Micrarchaeota archaeon]